MASTPWTITKRKRPSTPLAANRPRKRTRLSEPPVADRRRQQTLTQVQWVPSRPSSFQDEPMLTPLASDELSTAARRTSKKNSTLTQMNFFDSMTTAIDLSDGAPLHGDDGDAPLIPQLDGTYESPRKPRPRKSIGVKTRGGTQDMEGPSQEYLPLNKYGRQSHATGSPTQKFRRTSSRLARKEKETEQVLSDPVNNYKYFERALSASFLNAGDLSRPTLEIQDSTASNDDIFHNPSQSHPSTPLVAPRTPQRPAKIVLSSQSPESLPPTIRKSAAKVDIPAHIVRSPLRERSINLQFSSPKAAAKSRRSPSKEPAQKASKIVSLKLPKRRMHPPKSSVEDSQDIWSLPITSSPEKKRPMQPETATKHRAIESHADGLIRVPSDPLEIACTSQASLGLPKSPGESAEVESSSLDAIFGLRGVASTHMPAEIYSEVEQASQWQPQSEVVVRDSAHLVGPAPALAVDRKATKDSGLKTPQKAALAFIADSESEFGSPVANDTQFNEEVARRTSSPPVISEASHNTVGTDILSDATNKLKAAAALRMRVAELADSDEDAAAMPTPRLIRSSSRRSSRQEEAKSAHGCDEGLLPQPSLLASHRIQTQTLRVPLNDVPPSSSPLQSHKSITQRSVVRPASLPHPSQISTQEATQYGLSSIPVEEPTETPLKTERISIKDSSSMRVPLSQIPAHERSQGGRNVDLGLDPLDEMDDEDELDLNPSSPTEEASPVVSKDQSTRPASKRRADPPLIPAPIRKKRQTCTQLGPVERDSESLSEEEIDLDPRSNHSTPPYSKCKAHDATESQSFTTTVGTTTSNMAKSRDQPLTTLPITHDKSDNRERTTDQPQSPSLSESIASSPPVSSGRPSSLRKQWPPLAGFNNDTQSNFTQGGHVSAAYVHRQREKGALPAWFTPKPYKVPGYTRR